MMKRWAIAALLATCMTSAAFSGQPGPDWGRRGGQDQRPRQDQRGGPPPNAPDQRQWGQQQRQGALSDEDRRSLHRDLDKANREIYRRR